MQRQLALQRLQEQEREMQMRFEQQRQLTQMRQMQNYGYNQVQIRQTFPGQQAADNAQLIFHTDLLNISGQAQYLSLIHF